MTNSTRLKWTLKVLLTVALAWVVTANDKSPDNGVPELRSLSTFNTYDALGLIFISLGLAVSAAGGVGGGTILVPAMILIMGFDIKRATPVSNMAIVGGAIANAWFNIRKRHPTADRPLIDSDLSLAMIPLVMGGAVVGTILAKLLPSYILSLLFVVVLVLGGTRAVSKGMKMYQSELKSCKIQEVAPSPSESTGEQCTAYVVACSPASCTEDKTTDDMAADSASDSLLKGSGSMSSECTGAGMADDEMLSEILERERHFSVSKQGVIMLCYLGIVAASIAGAAVTCGGTSYWLLLILEVPWIAGFAVCTAVYLFRQHCLKVSVNYVFAAGDVHWTKETVVRFPLACAGAGLIAGLFGVGGGLVTGPLMIEMGIVPEVASSTTALMVLYSSAAATAKFAVFNMIAWDWALLLSAVALVVTAVSQVVILGFVRRTGRQSVIVLCIGATICTGAVLMTYQAIKSTIKHAGEPFEANVCR
ncbi:Sulfite exporter TauE/SafE family protein 3 [Phytophthora citrophthora]|uniref:Sulfite exporter TauE/SafE family protein 3 n=1 Tax=Phytophthora citrophthora TaxID=4793 RepID=A0AAD9GUS1_9STRA|nr:Sulfite exporter TauE/SafE family protein 3 [Phytophthora citrophthora]